MRLLNGDCLELMQDLPTNSVDMVLCDLPYGTTDCKWDSIIPFDMLWKQYERIAKDNGAIVLFSAQPFTTKLIHSNLKRFKYCWYWKKRNATGFTYARYQPMRCIEDICVFYKKRPTYNPQGLQRIENPQTKKHKKGQGGELWSMRSRKNEYTPRFKNYPKHILEFGKDTERHHPTQKPVALLEYLIKTYTDEGETVLDNCMGSGSTGVAAANTNRRFIGMEITEQYYNIAKDRIHKACAMQ